jgi:hypothetical protein
MTFQSTGKLSNALKSTATFSPAEQGETKEEITKRVKGL